MTTRDAAASRYSRCWALAPWACGVWLVLLAGCSGKFATYPVEGRVTDASGAPLAGVQLTWQRIDPPLSALAITDADGNYRLGTLQAADGAPLGEYRISLVEAETADPDAPPQLDIPKRYASFETSGLRYTVEARSNRYDIQLEP